MRKQRALTLATAALVVIAVATTVYRAVMPTLECPLEDRGISSVAVREQWTADPVPVLDMAGENEAGELLFTYPVGATRLPDGDILIGDEYDDNLKMVDTNGRLVREIGRAGSGPMEFSDVSELRRCTADSVFIYDRMQDQVTVLDPQGRMARTFGLTGAARTWSAMTFDCASDGTIASMRWPVTNAPMIMDGNPGTVLESLMYILSAQGVIADSITDIPAYETRPFGKVTHSAIGAGMIAIGTGDSSAVDIYSTEGDFLRTVLLCGPIREPTTSHYNAHIAQLVTPFAEASVRDDWRRQLREVPLPPQAPPYSNLLAGSEGLFWVTLTLPGDSLTLLRAVSADGILVADVRFDFDLTIYEIGSDYILGKYDDAEGEPHVAMFALDRPDLVR